MFQAAATFPNLNRIVQKRYFFQYLFQTYQVIQSSDLIHEMIVLLNMFFFVTIQNAIQVRKIAIQIDAVVVSSTDQVAVASLEHGESYLWQTIFFIKFVISITAAVATSHPSGFMLGIRCMRVEWIRLMMDSFPAK
jgi:hypothetical protein